MDALCAWRGGCVRSSHKTGTPAITCVFHFVVCERSLLIPYFLQVALSWVSDEHQPVRAINVRCSIGGRFRLGATDVETAVCDNALLRMQLL